MQQRAANADSGGLIDDSSHGVGDMTHSMVSGASVSDLPEDDSHRPLLEKHLDSLNSQGEVNLTGISKSELEKMLECVESSVRDHESGVLLNDRVYCERHWDEVLCWPPTPEGFSATLNCFEELRGIYYDKTKTVSRYCEVGGQWQNVKNYTSSCVPLRTATTEVTDDNDLGIQLQVYFFGYCLSLTALTLAIIIFLAFNLGC